MTSATPARSIVFHTQLGLNHLSLGPGTGSVRSHDSSINQHRIKTLLQIKVQFVNVFELQTQKRSEEPFQLELSLVKLINVSQNTSQKSPAGGANA